ncbi:MAG: divergent polysaccharide deacetylase family protein [Micavibrio sp.]
MTEQTTTTIQKFSPKAFAVGLVVVGLVYAGLAGFAFMKGPQVLRERQASLASLTVIIERVKPMAEPVTAEETHGNEDSPPTEEHGANDQTASPDTVTTDATQDPQATTPAHGDGHATPSETHEDDTQKPADAHHTAGTVNEEDNQNAGHDDHVALAPSNTLDSLPRNASGLCIAPVDGLYEDSKDGRLPAVRDDGLTSFKAYKKPFVNKDNKPVISIAIMDIGLSGKISESAIKSLPPEISLIISPYADGPDTWTNEARNAGHEVWLSLPMESETYPQTDSGPHTLLIGAPERENQEKLDWIMSRSVGYVGLVPTYQRTFMNSPNDARPVLGTIFKRGIGLIDDTRDQNTVAEMTALSMSAPYSNIDIWIDKPENTPETIKASLKKLEDIAKEQGLAAGIITPNVTSFREVQLWIESLKDKGIVLAPLSAQTGY